MHLDLENTRKEPGGVTQRSQTKVCFPEQFRCNALLTLCIRDHVWIEGLQHSDVAKVQEVPPRKPDDRAAPEHTVRIVGLGLQKKTATDNEYLISGN